MGHSGGEIVVVIPARMGSTRFFGKPLAPLAGRPMIAHVVERAASARGVHGVVVATDNREIADAGRSAGAEAVITGECASGTDRVAWAVEGLSEVALVINVQGDEPLLPPANIEMLIEAMLERAEIGLATLCRPLPPELVEDPNAVKVVRRADDRALYFSRSAVPYPRNVESARRLWRLHLGIYGYRPESLARFVALDPSPLEVAEGLEQLRALENGMDMLVLDAPYDSRGVDTPEDLERTEALLAAGKRKRRR